MTRLLLAAMLGGTLVTSTPAWTIQQSGVTARLRGVSASSSEVVWASGTDGTVVRTENGGRTWRPLTVPDAGTLDFRDIDAVDDRTAYVSSIGPGAASRIYKTSDAGRSWTLQFQNTDPKAFYDAIAFRDARRGFAFSDSVDSTFVILSTENGGKSWTRVPATALPAPLPGEGAYAASGTNIAVRGPSVWVGTTAARVLRSSDGGHTWRVSRTPLATGPSAGIFSIAFRNSARGIVVGGDYKKETEALDNAALTTDGGENWTPVRGLSGYRSAVAYVPALERTIVAIGPSGADVSRDDGRTWTTVRGPGFHAIAFAPGGRVGWAVGEKGAVGRIRM